jgi:hypothetical protein
MEVMRVKKNTIIYIVCLFAISISTLVICISRLLGGPLPDSLIRVVGIIDLIAIPVLVFVTVKNVGSILKNK